MGDRKKKKKKKKLALGEKRKKTDQRRENSEGGESTLFSDYVPKRIERESSLQLYILLCLLVFSELPSED